MAVLGEFRESQTCRKTVCSFFLSLLMSERFTRSHIKELHFCDNRPGVNFIESTNRRRAVGSSVTPTVSRNTSRKFAAVFVAAHRSRASPSRVYICSYFGFSRVHT